jgi:hypothetical protein
MKGEKVVQGVMYQTRQTKGKINGTHEDLAIGKRTKDLMDSTYGVRKARRPRA